MQSEKRGVKIDPTLGLQGLTTAHIKIKKFKMKVLFEAEINCIMFRNAFNCFK